uniref:Uncharacterized protein n=1 Tax=Toxoplasma gondii COUG TaxID=1074873 RepID=A0A2G8XYQ0_TOXGO|nr:hypothetical protein TGCOUG_286485 [Toxoplasma gondii COUG]
MSVTVTPRAREECRWCELPALLFSDSINWNQHHASCMVYRTSVAYANCLLCRRPPVSTVASNTREGQAFVRPFWDVGGSQDRHLALKHT